MGRRATTVVAACLLAVCGPAGVTSAHGDDPRIAIDVASLAPGAALTVHGFDFPYEDEVALALRGTSGDIDIGSVTTDLEGAFTHTVAVPLDLPLGPYVVVATDSHHEATSAPFMVEGVPLVEDDGVRIGEADSLLAPMPTSPGVAAAGTASTPLASSATTAPVAVVDEPAGESVTTAGRAAGEGELVAAPKDGGGDTGVVLAILGTVVIAMAIVIATWLLVRQRRTRLDVQSASPRV